MLFTIRHADYAIATLYATLTPRYDATLFRCARYAARYIDAATIYTVVTPSHYATFSLEMPLCRHADMLPVIFITLCFTILSSSFYACVYYASCCHIFFTRTVSRFLPPLRYGAEIRYAELATLFTLCL